MARLRWRTSHPPRNTALLGDSSDSAGNSALSERLSVPGPSPREWNDDLCGGIAFPRRAAALVAKRADAPGPGPLDRVGCGRSRGGGPDGRGGGGRWQAGAWRMVQSLPPTPVGAVEKPPTERSGAHTVAARPAPCVSSTTWRRGTRFDPTEGAEDHTCTPAHRLETGTPGGRRRIFPDMPAPDGRTRHERESAAEHSTDEPTVRRRGSGCQVRPSIVMGRPRRPLPPDVSRCG
jgi:hypothetical protein